MKKKKINILITDVNHPVTASAVAVLKNNVDIIFNIIGVDSSKFTYGKSWTDKLYNLPDPEDNEYINKLLRICKKEKVDLIVPWTNIEALVISKAQNKFKKINTSLLCNSQKTTATLIDKGKMYKALTNSGIPLPKYKLVSNPIQLKKAVLELGYPANYVVVKPANYSGGRGLWILDSIGGLVDPNKNKHLPLKAFLEILKSLDKRKKQTLNYIVMEYLAGKDYSVDVLCKKGQPLHVVQRIRIVDFGGISTVGETTYDKKIKKIIIKIIKFFNLDLNCNIQLRYRTNKTGEPYVYDINPRISGTIVVNHFAGINLLLYGIYQALGIKLPKKINKRYKKLMMIRHWSEKYQYGNEDFPS